MRTSYERVDDPDQLPDHIAEMAPRTVIVDVEPLVAFRDTDPATLDRASPHYSTTPRPGRNRGRRLRDQLSSSPDPDHKRSTAASPLPRLGRQATPARALE
jgi:hypothetical protein